IDEGTLAETAKEITKSGGNTFSHPVDLADPVGLNDLVARINREYGGVDILVNISGGPPPTPAMNVPADSWTKYFQSMVLSMIYVTDLVLPSMRAKRWGRVITSTSSGVIAPIANLCISNTLRSSLTAWSKTLAREVAPDGVTVNLVIPGRISTQRTKQLDEARAKRENKTIEEVVKSSVATIPMQRYGHPEEYASVVAFLASNSASYITGTMIRVDGGMIQSL
ncbi:MAG: SDR family oxidoreductase, partial [Acidobacteriales bacterium]|nr:SDR family oxidoreductase [Terriglobales bacterium]